jgi:steroid delta-isomerase-like uncharacterized protein
MASARVQMVRRYWDEAWTNGETAYLSEFYAPTFRVNDEEETPEGFGDGIRAWRQHFPDFTVDVNDVWESTDAVITRLTFTGTHLGDFRVLPATGRTMQGSGLEVFEFDGSRVVRQWHETDHWEMFRQLGAPFTQP